MYGTTQKLQYLLQPSMMETKTLVIGGLIDTATDKKEQFAPVVGKIPLIKYLFGYEDKAVRKRELVILLAPKII